MVKTKKSKVEELPVVEEEVKTVEEVKDVPVVEKEIKVIEDIVEEAIIDGPLEKKEVKLELLNDKSLIEELGILQFSPVFQNKWIVEFKDEKSMNRFTDLQKREELLATVCGCADTQLLSINSSSLYFNKID